MREENSTGRVIVKIILDMAKTCPGSRFTVSTSYIRFAMKRKYHREGKYEMEDVSYRTVGIVLGYLVKDGFLGLVERNNSSPRTYRYYVEKERFIGKFDKICG